MNSWKFNHGSCIEVVYNFCYLLASSEASDNVLVWSFYRWNWYKILFLCGGNFGPIGKFLILYRNMIKLPRLFWNLIGICVCFIFFSITQWIYYIYKCTMIITIQFYRIAIPQPQQSPPAPNCFLWKPLSFSKSGSQYLLCKEVHSVLFSDSTYKW